MSMNVPGWIPGFDYSRGVWIQPASRPLAGYRAEGPGLVPSS